MKICYIAHPIGGDVKNNIEKVISICRTVNLNYNNVVPFVPYLSDLYALDDNEPEERDRGIKNDIALLKKGFIDELWLYGDRISNGMRAEINIAKTYGIRIVCKTPETQKEL